MMKIYNNIRSATRPQEIEITDSAVFLAINIMPYTKTIEDHVEEGYVYDYIEYGKDEYLIKLTHENNSLQQEILDTQLALVELYEGGRAND